MIRVREIDGRVIVDNDPDTEAEFLRNQAENARMFSYLAKKTKERIKLRQQDNQRVDKLLAEALSPAPPPRIEPAPPVADTAQPESKAAPVVEGWAIKRPQRFQGYGSPLFKLLTAAHVEGRPIPTAREVIDAWAAQRPPEVIEATGDTLKYYDAKGNTKVADLDAIRQAINRMID